MRLFIAEKPSLGRVIAATLAGNRGGQEFEGFIRIGRDTVVTWCFGHLLELATPGHYDRRWEKWSIEHLPIEIGADKWQLVPKASAKKQLRTIRDLLTDASLVVNAGDPDREGQMLVDEVLEYFSWRGETKRILVQDTTPTGVSKALKGIRPNADFANLFAAAKCRARADWLVGLNLTRAASTRIGLTASIGRVQTPTLALIVRRDRAIENHKTSVFYTLEAHVATASDALVMLHEDASQRITDQKVAKGIASRLKGTQVELLVTEKPVTERAPLPHTLATFHKAGEERHGWSAKKALEVLQSLYEKQLTSYPRTGCPYLPADQASRALPTAQAILKAGHVPAAAAVADLMAPSKRVYNDAKVEEHHGLIPTGKLPGASLSQAEKQGWAIVSEQFLKSLLPDYKAARKEVSFEFEGRTFKSAGEQPINVEQSWRVLEPKVGVDKKPIKPLRIALGDGERGRARVGQANVKQGKTVPPKPYTEASLVADMKSIHKYIEDARLKAVLKETVGIGTEATHAAIIETLKDRQYITGKKPARGKIVYLSSTRFGCYLIDNTPGALADPGVTAAWEEELNRIAKGESKPEPFMERIGNYVSKHVQRIASTEFPEPPKLQQAPKKATRSRKVATS